MRSYRDPPPLSTSNRCTTTLCFQQATGARPHCGGGRGPAADFDAALEQARPPCTPRTADLSRATNAPPNHPRWDAGPVERAGALRVCVCAAAASLLDGRGGGQARAAACDHSGRVRPADTPHSRPGVGVGVGVWSGPLTSMPPLSILTASPLSRAWARSFSGYTQKYCRGDTVDERTQLMSE